MSRNLTDLNNHLFAQLERLGDEDLTPEEMATELHRSKGITDLGKTIIANAQLALDAKVAVQEHQLKDNMKMLGVD